MHTNEFEEALDRFLDSSQYDQAADYLYALARAAFAAGWQAAGGPPPKPHRPFEVIRNNSPH